MHAAVLMAAEGPKHFQIHVRQVDSQPNVEKNTKEVIFATRPDP